MENMEKTCFKDCHNNASVTEEKVVVSYIGCESERKTLNYGEMSDLSDGMMSENIKSFSFVREFALLRHQVQ